MGSIGPWQLIIIALVVLVLFGRGRISEMMGDFGKGINSFKKGMSEESERSSSSPQQIQQQASSAPGTTTPASGAAPAPAENGSTNSGN